MLSLKHKKGTQLISCHVSKVTRSIDKKVMAFEKWKVCVPFLHRGMFKSASKFILSSVLRDLVQS